MIDERDIEGYLVREVGRVGGLCLKLDSSTTKGIQDRLLLLPGANVVFVEMKKPGGRVGVLQQVRKKQIERLGFKSVVVWDREGVDRLLETLK
jgi:hypothetical protein